MKYKTYLHIGCLKFTISNKNLQYFHFKSIVEFLILKLKPNENVFDIFI